MNRKVIFITREGYRLAGARVRCYNFARALKSYGIETEVLSFADSLGAKDGEKEAGMGFFDKAVYNCKAFSKLAKEKKSIFYIHRFNYHTFAPWLAGIGAGNRIILDLDDWEIREDPKYYFGFYPSSKAHFLTQWLARKSAACIAASRFLEGFLKTYNSRVYYIPTAVDTGLFKGSIEEPDDNEMILSWTGTLHKKEYIENLELALECFSALKSKYPHLCFDIVGDGIYRGLLEDIIGRYADSRIRMKGWMSPEAIPTYLAGIHIGLFPVARDSKFNRAKSPTKLFEYMAMRKPTLSSAVGEAQEVVRDGENGFLAKDKEEFVRKLEILINDKKLRGSMGQSARKRIEEDYSLDVLGRKLFEIIRVIPL